MKKLFLTLFLIINLFAYNKQDDNKIDSILSIIQDKEIYQQIDYISEQAWNYRNDNPYISLRLIEKAIEYAKNINYEEILPKLYNFEGIFYRNINNYIKAEYYFISALRLGEEYKIKREIAYAYNNIANLYILNHDTTNGFKYLRNALKIFKETNDKLGQAYVFQRFGQAYKYLKLYELSIKHYYNAYILRKELKDTNSFLTSLREIIYCYLKKSNIIEAKNNLDTLFKYSKYLQKSKYQFFETQLIYSYYLSNIGKYNESNRLALKFLDYYVNIKSWLLVEDVLKIVITNSEKLNDKDKEIFYLKFLSKVRDSADASVNNPYFLQSINKYEFDKTLNIHKKNELYAKIIILTITILVILGMYSYIRIRKKNKELQFATQKLEELNIDLIAQYNELDDLRNQLEKNNKFKDRLISIIGHDLINPIGSINSFLEIVLEDIEECTMDESIKVNLIYTKQSAEQSLELIQNILLWNRSINNRIDFYPSNINLKNAITKSLVLLKLQANNKNIDIIILIDDNKYIFVDENMLVTILRNLLSNAIKFTKIGGEIKIYCKEDDKYDKIIIEDNGIGMTKETKEKILNSDIHSSLKGTSGEQGTGLGLILIKEFIKLHNGIFDIESEINVGSKFIIGFPKIK